MNPQKIVLLSTVLATLSGLAFGETLKDRAGFGGTMSAADLTAVLVAEIELCEQRAPEFKAQGSAHVTKFRTDARMKEMERQAEYQKVLPEARALVLERLKLQDLPTLCRNTLDRIKR